MRRHSDLKKGSNQSSRAPNRVKGARAATSSASSPLREHKWFIIIVGCLLVSGIWMFMFTGSSSPEITLINDRSLINFVNENPKTGFQVKPLPEYENWTIAEFVVPLSRSRFGLFEHVPICIPSTTTARSIPLNYNYLTEYSHCKPPVHTWQEKNCSASYATAVATFYSVSHCIHQSKKNPEIKEPETVFSAQFLLSCDRHNFGCGGGYVDYSLHTLGIAGIVTEKCFHWNQGKNMGCNLDNCNNEDLSYSEKICKIHSVEDIKRQILSDGPVLAQSHVTDDLSIYSRGLYQIQKTSRRLTEQRTPLLTPVLIIGWGIENKIPFWIISSPFGQHWGERGTGRISMDSNLIKTELALSITPKFAPPVSQKQITPEPADDVNDS